MKDNIMLLIILILLSYYMSNQKDKISKAKSLPSLEVKIHPPDEFQPELQSKINEMEAKREKNERESMKKLEEDYNKELKESATKINKIIKEALSIFEDKNLLSKSAEYAIPPPIKKNEKQKTSFKEIYSKINIPSIHDTLMNVSMGEIDENKNGSLDDLLLSKSSFLDTGGDYTKSISVKMKLPKNADSKVISKITEMESKRDKQEKKLFEKAKEEFKLISQITIKELQVNLNHELTPFFAMSQMGELNSVVDKNMKKPSESRFLEVNKDIGVSLTSPTLPTSTNIKESNINSTIESCNKMKLMYSELDIDCSLLNTSTFFSSFMETSSSSQQGGEDFINVKFSAAEESYPTIEKICSQMMTRRDLAEKFERLKILELEMNLQKALNEIIQDILHEQLYKIMSKFGPAIEGMRENFKKLLR